MIAFVANALMNERAICKTGGYRGFSMVGLSRAEYIIEGINVLLLITSFYFANLNSKHALNSRTELLNFRDPIDLSQFAANRSRS